MSNFEIPTREEVRDRLCANLRNTMLKHEQPVAVNGPGDDLYDISDAAAGEFHQAYGHASRAVNEAFPQTASYANLVRHARRFIGDPLPATKATGAAEGEGAFRATGTQGSSWSVGDTFVQRDTGQRFRATAAGQIGAQQVAFVPIEAIIAGAAGRLLDGTHVVWEQPPSGINTTATVNGDMQGGTDAEKQDHYLGRYDAAMQSPGMAGTPGWFEWLLLQVPGVGRATCFRNYPDLGQTAIAILDMEGDPVSDDVFTAAQTKIDDNRQVCGEAHPWRPVLVPVDLTFELYLASGFEFSGAPTSAVVSGSTPQVIKVADASGYRVGQWVALRDLLRARKVAVIDLPGNTLTLDSPLTDRYGQTISPESGDAVIAACPTYEALAQAIVDLFVGLRTGEPYYRSQGEGALRDIYEVLRPEQISPAGNVEAIVNPSRMEQLTLGTLILQARSD